MWERTCASFWSQLGLYIASLSADLVTQEVSPLCPHHPVISIQVEDGTGRRPRESSLLAEPLVGVDGWPCKGSDGKVSPGLGLLPRGSYFAPEDDFPREFKFLHFYFPYYFLCIFPCYSAYFFSLLYVSLMFS